MSPRCVPGAQPRLPRSQQRSGRARHTGTLLIKRAPHAAFARATARGDERRLGVLLQLAFLGHLEAVEYVLKAVGESQ